MFDFFKAVQYDFLSKIVVYNLAVQCRQLEYKHIS